MTDLTHSAMPKTASGLTPLLSKLLGSQELAAHRATVAFELEVLAKKVDRFGWDRDRGTPAQDRQLVDWMDALHDYPLDEVKAACKLAIQENPNRCPNEGHIKAIILRERGKLVAAQPKPQPQAPARSEPDADTKARVAAMVAEVGAGKRPAKQNTHRGEST